MTQLPGSGQTDPGHFIGAFRGPREMSNLPGPFAFPVRHIGRWRMPSVSSAIAVPLCLCTLACALGASSSKAAPPAFAGDESVRLASSSPADTLPEKKKERVPKSNSDTRERGGGAAKADGDGGAVDEKKEGGFFDRCITDFFLGLFHPHEDETPRVTAESPLPASATPPSTPQATLAPEEMWGPGILAMTLPADSTAEGVMVWSMAGGEAGGAEVVSHLSPGTDVVVRGSSRLLSGQWLQVSLGGVEEPAGWVSSADLVQRRIETASPIPRAPVSASPASGPLLPIEISFGASGFQAGPSDVSDEYVEGPWRFDFRVAWPSASTWRAGFAFGSSQAHGNPRFDYKTGNQIDRPSGSRLVIVDFGVDGGQCLNLARNWRLAWAIGPTLSYVQERADIRTEVLQDGSWIPVGTREETLSKWRPGGDVKVFFENRVDAGWRLGLALRAFVIPWHSEGQKSLTLDFIGDRSIAGGSVGFYFGI